MTSEFTGERVIPGEVDVDLWNEHVARYVFASSHAAGTRVLDIGCGAGYGSAMLLQHGAISAAALDISSDALKLAGATGSGAMRVQASASALPLQSASFDLIVAFEVIEHLRDWSQLLREAARVLAPAGVFFVSTPNKSFYAETRAETGPNPFHEHEFEYDEFEAALRETFPHTALFLQDHTEGVAFRPVSANADAALRIDSSDPNPRASSFFLAVCSNRPLPELRGLVYIPVAANAVREKLRHIDRLKGEIAKKEGWLAYAQSEHAELVDKHRDLLQELKRSNEWAESLNEKLHAAGERVLGLQDELAEQHRVAVAALAELQLTVQERTAWARQRDEELARCVDILHQTEADLEERTRWALQLDQQRTALERELADARSQLQAVQSSRWVRLGRVVGVGPELAKA